MEKIIWVMKSNRFDLHPDDAKLIEEPIPFTTYEYVQEFPDELLKLREEIQNYFR